MPESEGAASLVRRIRDWWSRRRERYLFDDANEWTGDDYPQRGYRP